MRIPGPDLARLGGCRKGPAVELKEGDVGVLARLGAIHRWYVDVEGFDSQFPTCSQDVPVVWSFRPVFRPPENDLHSDSTLSTIIMVDIHLLVHGSEVPFLSIPLTDVQRLSIHSFKWLHFVLFAICGTPGELLATPGGNPIDYHSTELVADTKYYFKPSGNILFYMWGLLLITSRRIYLCGPGWTE